MNIEKLIGSISIVITIIVTIIAFISGTFWINAMHVGDSKQGMWLFITINCVVILLIIMGINQILSYRQKREKYKAIEYVNKKKVKITEGFLLIGGFLAAIFGIILIYVLALVPKESLNVYIYPISAIIWIGIILIFIGFIYQAVTDAFKTQQPNNKEDSNSN